MKFTSSGFYHEDTYIALDSDLIICFANMYEYHKRFNIVDKKLLSKKLYAAQNNFEECKFVFDCILDGSIKPVVTNSIFNEISGSIYGTSGDNRMVLDFLTKFCYTPKPNELLSKRRRDKIQVLAKAYCLPYKNKRGQVFQAPMNFTYSAYHDMTVPENDAVAMAEATCLNVYFLTYNGKHFVWKNKGYLDFGDDSPAKERTVGIIEINKQNKYFTTNKIGGEIVPKPMHLRNFVAAVKNCDGGLHYFDISEPNPDRLVKLASLVDLEEFRNELTQNDAETDFKL